MSRELRTRARARIQPDADDESDESEDADGPAQIPSTSIQDLVNPADAQQFDQTFSDADANLNIEGAFDPTAGDKQVIPRIAFVLNFNLVYNEQQERWEPDTGNESGGGALQSTTLVKTTTQSIPTNNTFAQLTFQQADVDSLDGADTSNNQITVPATGEYLISAGVGFTNFDPGADLDVQVRASGENVISFENTASTASNINGLNRSISKVTALTAGDALTMRAAGSNTASAAVEGFPSTSYLSAVQLA